MQRLVVPVFLALVLQCTIASIDSNLKNLDLGNIGNIDASNISQHLNLTVEDGQRIFKEKCIKNGGEQAHEHAEQARDVLQECVKGLVDYEKLQEEMEEAKPSGDLDSVFKKYCQKSPDLTKCINTYTTAVEPCLEAEEKKSKDIVLNVTDQLVNFICFKEGDRIALFIAEGGPECLNKSQESIKECIHSTFKHRIPTGKEPSLNDLPTLLFQADDCADFVRLQTCIVSELEKCSEPTPANIVDSLFNFIRKATPCSKFKLEELGIQDSRHATKAGSSAVSPISLIFVSIASYAVLRLLH